MQRMQDRGIQAPRQPLDEKKQPISPQLAQDLTRLSIGALGQLLAQATSCADYASYVSTVAELEATEAEHAYELVWARVRLEKTGTNPEKDAKATMDNRVQMAKQEHFARHAFARLAFTMSKNYERDLNTVSREITRRSQEWDRARSA